MVIFGPPGGGKGTQCEKIVKDYSLSHVSTGNLLRQAVADENDLGRKVKDIIGRGELVDDSTMLAVVKQAFAKPAQFTHGWVLDGFPRTGVQATQLDQHLTEIKKPIHMAMLLDVPDEVIVERISQRMTHIPSGRVYHVSYKPPKVQGKDDLTGEPLAVREDDKEERVRARLNKYHSVTRPLLEYYQQKGLLVVVASKTSHEGYVEIKRLLDKALKH